MSRVLVLDHEPPQATRDGGAARMLGILELLRAARHDVAFAAAAAWDEALVATAQRLQTLGIEIVARDGALEPYLAAHAAAFDVVIASRLGVALVAVPVVRRVAPRTRLLYDAVHVHHLTEFRLAKQTGNRALLAAALRHREEEREIVASVDAVIAVTGDDADELADLVPGTETHVVAAVHGVADPADSASPGREGIVFLGYYGMPENELAARRLVETIWPRVEAIAGPTALTMLGAAPPAWLIDLAADHPRLHVPGFLPDVDPTLRCGAVMVVPMTGGSGVKTKVLHAFARRLPVVGTGDALRGIAAVDGFHVLRAETDDEIATAAARALADPALRERLAASAAALLAQQFGPQVAAAGLRAALGDAGAGDA